MRMYKRFRDSLSNPRGLVAYRKDRLWKVLLYLSFFALLMGTRSLIDVAQYDGLSFAYQEVMVENIEEMDETCAIVDGRYGCDEEASQLFYEDLSIRFFFDSYETFEQTRYDDEQYAVVVHEERVRFLFNGTPMYEQSLASFSDAFLNLDFALQTSDPDSFHEQVIAGVSDFLVATKWTWGFGAIFAEILLGLLLFLFFTLVNSYFMYRRFMMVKFKAVFVMTVYASTALFVVLIFDQMFQFSFFITLLLIFIAFRQNSQLNDELMRRMMQHQMSLAQMKQEQDEEESQEEDDEEEEDKFE